MQLVPLVVAALAGLALATSIPNEYVAVFAGTADSNAISQHMARVAASGAQVLFEYNFGDFRGYSLRVPEGSALSNAQVSFLSAPEVAYYEQNQVYHTMAPVFRGGANQTRTSRARVFAAECNLQEEATWGLVRTSEKALYIDGMYPWSTTYDGAGVTVYVVDTGIYLEHEDFERRAIWGYDAVDDPSPETDLNGHGTHCAGTAISKTYGIAKAATAVAVRVLNADGQGSTAGVIAGIQFVARDGASKRSVASMSLGGSYSAALNNAVKSAVSQKIPFIVAAGNEAQDACKVSPASEPTAITVMCSDSSDQFCYFSNFGTCADIIAPGMGITSTWINGKNSDNTISGTSMSTPHVAGVVAKLLSGNHTISTPEQVRSLLIEFAGDGFVRSIPTTAPTVNALLHYPCGSEE